MKAVSLVLLALVTVVGVASGQAPDSIVPGARVRVTPATPERVIVGQLIAVTDSALLIRPGSEAGDITIPRSAVMRLEVSRGTSRASSAGRGALFGMIIVGAAGFGMGDNDCGSDAWFCIDRPTGALIGGVFGVVTGSIVGLLVGSFERWQERAVPVSLSVVPTGGSLSMVSRIAF